MVISSIDAGRNRLITIFVYGVEAGASDMMVQEKTSPATTKETGGDMRLITFAFLLLPRCSWSASPVMTADLFTHELWQTSIADWNEIMRRARRRIEEVDVMAKRYRPRVFGMR